MDKNYKELVFNVNYYDYASTVTIQTLPVSESDSHRRNVIYKLLIINLVSTRYFICSIFPAPLT
ncbi:hypothetical protein SAMN05660816_03586 [Niastella yeongjuensis]|nr:hypothetical protein SAMN05660816_03586 [Niastella yeongjuensis]